MTPSDIARHAAQVLRDHADICSRAGQSAVLLEEAEAIEQELAAMAGPAPDPQGADDRCRVSENGSVSHRWACDFGPDCPAPGGVMHDPQGADEPLFMGAVSLPGGGVPDEPGDDDFPTTAAVLDSLEDIEQFHDDADMQTAAGVARLALIGYRDRYAELLAEVERLRAAAPASEAVRALFDAVAETVERIAPSNGGDPLPLSEEDATALILWTYQVLRDDLRAGSPPPTPAPEQETTDGR